MRLKAITILLLFTKLAIGQNFSNDELLDLAGDFEGVGQVLSGKDGYLLQVTKHGLKNKSRNTKNLVWLIKVNRNGKVLWKKNFDNGCNSRIFDFISVKKGYIGAITGCEPELLHISNQGKIKKRKKLDSLNGASRFLKTENGNLKFIGEKVAFEGLKETDSKPKRLMYTKLVTYHSIILNKNWKFKKKVKLDSLKVRHGPEFPISNRLNQIYFHPWKNGKLQIFNSKGEILVKKELKVNNDPDEIICEEFNTNYQGNLVFRRSSIMKNPERHISKIEIVCVDSLGENVFAKKVIDSTTFNNNHDLIQTADGGYLYLFRSDKLTLVKLNSNGNIRWRENYGKEINSTGHMSVAERDNGDIVVLGLKKTGDGYKPILTKFNEKGDLK